MCREGPELWRVHGCDAQANGPVDWKHQVLTLDAAQHLKYVVDIRIIRSVDRLPSCRGLGRLDILERRIADVAGQFLLNLVQLIHAGRHHLEPLLSGHAPQDLDRRFPAGNQLALQISNLGRDEHVQLDVPLPHLVRDAAADKGLHQCLHGAKVCHECQVSALLQTCAARIGQHTAHCGALDSHFVLEEHKRDVGADRHAHVDLVQWHHHPADGLNEALDQHVEGAHHLKVCHLQEVNLSSKSRYNFTLVKFFSHVWIQPCLLKPPQRVVHLTAQLVKERSQNVSLARNICGTCPSLRLYRVDIRVDREREHHEVFNALISERPVGNCVRMPAHRFLRVWRLGGGCGWAISGRTCLGSRGRFGQRRRRASTCPLDDLAGSSFE
mmetsp:Transcript_17894/g.46622  ORF Transcript_17894/g.46622 Transcript_17894/m.46622 type:complete len:383 (+) Transcript_17894:216-1364(+)